MTSVLNIFAVLVVSAGTFFFLAGTVGLLRFPNTLTRLHALTKADNVGLGLVVFGLLPLVVWPFGALKLFAVWLLVLLSGSIIAQLGVPDMRIPIAYALAYPYRLKGGWKALDVTRQGELSFLSVESNRYPALKLAYAALKEGGTMPAVLNASNEVAVAAFLERQIGFRDIHRVIDNTMQDHGSRPVKEVDEILEVDRWAREKALSLIH